MKWRVRKIFWSLLSVYFLGAAWFLSRRDIFALLGASVVGEKDYPSAFLTGFFLLLLFAFFLMLAYRAFSKIFPVPPFFRSLLLAFPLALFFFFATPLALKFLHSFFAERPMRSFSSALPSGPVLLFSTFLFGLCQERWLSAKKPQEASK